MPVKLIELLKGGVVNRILFNDADERLIVIDAVAAAQHGLAVVPGVPGEADARPPVVLVAALHALAERRVVGRIGETVRQIKRAGDERAARRIGALRRARRVIELRQERGEHVTLVAHLTVTVIADAEVELEIGSHLPSVLHIKLGAPERILKSTVTSRSGSA